MPTVQEQLTHTIGSLVIENAQLREELARVTEKLAAEMSKPSNASAADEAGS